MDIENIIFSGGGIQGLSYLGIIEVLQNNNTLNQLKTITGTSIGSIAAVLLCMGFQSENLKELLFNTDYTSLVQLNLFNFTAKYGIDSGHKIVEFIQNIISQKYSPDITFKELYEKTNIKLTLTSLCVNDGEILYINYETCPNLKIIHGIRMSISIPFLFTAVKYNKKYYVDGGIFDNFPIHLYPPENTLGINIQNENCSEIHNVEQYIHTLFNCVLNKVQYKNDKEYKIITIQSETSSFDPTLDKNGIQNLYNIGKNVTTDFLNIHIPKK